MRVCICVEKGFICVCVEKSLRLYVCVWKQAYERIYMCGKGFICVCVEKGL